MNRNDIIKAFLDRTTDSAVASSLRIQGNKLFSYNTVIAQWEPELLIINRTRYSVTTSRQQNEVARKAHARVWNYVAITEIRDNVKIDTQDLKQFVV